MKICKCVKCGKGFSMPDNFYKIIICEDCDPAMNTEKPRNLAKPDVKPLLSDVLAEIQHEVRFDCAFTDFQMNVLKQKLSKYFT